MKTGTNIGNRPGPMPGNSGAVREQKAIAMGMTAPKSARETKPIGMEGGKCGTVKVTGLTNR